MSALKVTIVIVNYNGKELLKLALSSINKKNKKEHEIIVVDNNSNDGSSDFIRKNYSYVKVIENKKNLGYCGINSALPYCNGKYILFLNNDIQIEKNCIKELVNAIEQDDKVAMAAPRLVNYYDKKLSSNGTWVSRAFYNGHIGGEGSNYKNIGLKEIPYLGVGLIRTDAIKKFGYLFDSDYFIYSEDLDLGLRLRLIGYKVVFAQRAIIYHLHSATTRTFGSYSTFLLERNLLTTFFKVLSLKNIILFLPYVILMRTLAFAKDIASFKFSNALARIGAVSWVIFNFDLIFKKRKILQKLRNADDKFILEVFSERYLFRKAVIV